MATAMHPHHPIPQGELVDVLEASMVGRVEVCPLCDLSDIVSCPACDGRGWILFAPDPD